MTPFFVIVFLWVFRATRRVASDIFLKTRTSRLFLKTRATSVLIDLRLKRFHLPHIFYQIYSNVKSTPEWYHYCWLHCYVHISVLIWTGWKPNVSRQLLCELSGEGKWEIQLQSIEEWTFRVSYFNEVDHSFFVYYIILFYSYLFIKFIYW